MNEDAPVKINLEEVPEFIRPYFEAKEMGTLQEYYRFRFINLRDNYKNDLPEEDVRNLATLDNTGHFVGDNYKCRGNYIVSLGSTLSTAISDGVITDPKLISEIETFCNYDFRFNHGERTTQQEIDMINSILAKVIKYLKD